MHTRQLTPSRTRIFAEWTVGWFDPIVPESVSDKLLESLVFLKCD